MRNVTANWFECKVRYERTTEDGTQKKVTEQYVVDALSFAEAEQRITGEMSYRSGEYEVADVKKAQYKEVLFSDSCTDDRWYKCRLQFITIDEKTGKEKRTGATYLVQAASLDGAMKNIDKSMVTTMIDYEKSNIAETKIMDVFEYAAKQKSAEPLDSMANKLDNGKK